MVTLSEQQPVLPTSSFARMFRGRLSLVFPRLRAVCEYGRVSSKAYRHSPELIDIQEDIWRNPPGTGEGSTITPNCRCPANPAPAAQERDLSSSGKARCVARRSKASSCNLQRDLAPLRAARAAGSRAGYGAAAPPACCWRRHRRISVTARLTKSIQSGVR